MSRKSLTLSHQQSSIPKMKRKYSNNISELLNKVKMEDDDEAVDLLVSEMSEEKCVFLEAAVVESPNLVNLKEMVQDVSEIYILSKKEDIDVSLAVQDKKNKLGSSCIYDLIHPIVTIKQDIDCEKNYNLMYVSFSFFFFFFLPFPFSIILLLLATLATSPPLPGMVQFSLCNKTVKATYII